MRNPVNIKLLNDAVDEAMAYPSDLEVDEYAARYLPPARALSLKRSYRVFRTCGNDKGPTFHATSICQLAVKASQWDIFLRAHLDVMMTTCMTTMKLTPLPAGRRMSRNWSNWEQYMNLLVGTRLRSRDVNINHYQGSVPGMGAPLLRQRTEMKS